MIHWFINYNSNTASSSPFLSRPFHLQLLLSRNTQIHFSSSPVCYSMALSRALPLPWSSLRTSAKMVPSRVFSVASLIFMEPATATITTTTGRELRSTFTNSPFRSWVCLSSSPNAYSDKKFLFLSPVGDRRLHRLNRLFCSEATNNKKINTKVNFSLSDYDSDSDEESKSSDRAQKEIDKSKLPPPYDPFNKKPAIEEPEDPKDLQSVFHKMRSEGLFNHAVKMFDALSKDGLTHEALELFSQIKDKGHMPDVVAYTAVIEAYANAGGQSKEAHKAFLRMLASGVAPNAYTYTVLIKGLAADGKLGDAKKYMVEMISKGMQPNAATYTAVFEAFAWEQKVDEGREFLQQMKDKGFVPNEKAVREVLDKRGQVFRTVINILFDK